jgi:hypothetical protein
VCLLYVQVAQAPTGLCGKRPWFTHKDRKHYRHGRRVTACRPSLCVDGRCRPPPFPLSISQLPACHLFAADFAQCRRGARPSSSKQNVSVPLQLRTTCPPCRPHRSGQPERPASGACLCLFLAAGVGAFFFLCVVAGERRVFLPPAVARCPLRLLPAAVACRPSLLPPTPTSACCRLLLPTPASAYRLLVAPKSTFARRCLLRCSCPPGLLSPAVGLMHGACCPLRRLPPACCTCGGWRATPLSLSVVTGRLCVNSSRR